MKDLRFGKCIKFRAYGDWSLLGRWILRFGVMVEGS